MMSPGFEQVKLVLSLGKLFLSCLIVLFYGSAVSAQQLPFYEFPQTNSPEQNALAAQQRAPAEPGSISGKIVDQSGANIVGAAVKLTHDNGTSARETTSDEDGLFVFSHVPPCTFHLTISSLGLASQELSGTLQSGEPYVTPLIVMIIPTQITRVHVGLPPEELATEQIKEQEKQRVFGVIPNFYVSYVPNAAPLAPKHKFELAWKSASDPITIVGVAALAGIDQAADRWGAYGQGAEGYAKRFGAAYADDFVGTMIGSALLPAVLKQDPRYFYRGKGSVTSRALYAIAVSVICKSDSGHWQPNYSQIAGGLAGAGIAQLYYPPEDRQDAVTIFRNFGIAKGSNAVENLIQEFVIPHITWTVRLPSFSRGNPSN